MLNDDVKPKLDDATAHKFLRAIIAHSEMWIRKIYGEERGEYPDGSYLRRLVEKLTEEPTTVFGVIEGARERLRWIGLEINGLDFSEAPFAPLFSYLDDLEALCRSDKKGTEFSHALAEVEHKHSAR